MWKEYWQMTKEYNNDTRSLLSQEIRQSTGDIVFFSKHVLRYNIVNAF